MVLFLRSLVHDTASEIIYQQLKSFIFYKTILQFATELDRTNVEIMPQLLYKINCTNINKFYTLYIIGNKY